MDNNYVKLDISDYIQMLERAYLAEKYKSENLKLKEEQLKLEEEVSILNSIVDDRLANEECMTDPSQDDTVENNKIKASYEFISGLTDLKIGNNFAQVKKTDLGEFKVTEDDWKELLAYLEIQQKDINILCSTVSSLVSEKYKLTIDKFPR